MNISIIGGGSIGLLMGGLFARSNHNVTIYTRTLEQCEKINHEGLIFITPEGERFRCNCKAKVLEDFVDDGIVFLTVKSHQLQSVLNSIGICEHLVFLQNGISHLDMIESMKQNNVSIGIVEHGAVRTDYNSVEWRGEGRIRYCDIVGATNNETKHALIHTVGLHMEFEQGYEEMVYEKLIINACINPLTALLQVKNGELVKNDYYFQTMKMVFEEVSNILHISYDKKESLLQKVIRVCKSTEKNDSSMKIDVAKNRITEIDSILLPIINRARKQERKVPYVQQLYWLIKGREKEMLIEKDESE